MGKTGFTLLELLIVIALLAILLMMLLPILLGARVSAYKKALQLHSANVYKVINAVSAEDPYLNRTTIASQVEAVCLNSTSTLSIGGRVFNYGWAKAPEYTAACTVVDSGADFTVTLVGNAVVDNKSSINGQNPT